MSGTGPDASPSRRRLRLLFSLPFLVVVLVWLVAAVVMHWWQVPLRSGPTQAQRQEAVAGAAFRTEVARVNREFPGNDPASRDRRRQAIQVAQANRNTVWFESSKAYDAWRPPGWLVPPLLWILKIVPMLIAALVAARVWLQFLGTRLHGDLSGKGYDWLTHYDAMWLAVALRGESQRIPPAADFMAVPDSRETVDSLVAFVRMRKGFRVR